jgi:hypothetical protein
MSTSSLSYGTLCVLTFMCSSVFGVQPMPPDPVDLRTAGNYAILAKAGVTNVPTSVITGDIGVSPIAQTAITGFSLVADASGQFATSSQVIGKIYAANDISPTPSGLTVAVSDMQTAYVDAVGRSQDFTDHLTGDLSGATLASGVYKFGSSVVVSGDCTISGTDNDQWIFQIDGDLDIADGKKVVLAGGALASNIVWVVAGVVRVGAGAHLEGIVLGATAAHFRTKSSMNGRVLVQTEATLQKTTISIPQ